MPARLLPVIVAAMCVPCGLTLEALFYPGVHDFLSLWGIGHGSAGDVLVNVALGLSSGLIWLVLCGWTVVWTRRRRVGTYLCTLASLLAGAGAWHLYNNGPFADWGGRDFAPAIGASTVWVFSTLGLWRESAKEAKARLHKLMRIAIRCPDCGYSMGDAVSLVCPECGRSSTVRALVQVKPRRSLNRGGIPETLCIRSETGADSRAK
jgi:hypothetical protein